MSGNPSIQQSHVEDRPEYHDGADNRPNIGDFAKQEEASQPSPAEGPLFYQKSWIALQRARADPRDPYNPPLMWGSWTPWKGCPVFILRRWEDISKFSFLV